jgi:hypothetical protein
VACLAEAIDALLSREQKLQEVDAFIFACRIKAQQHQVLFQPDLCHSTIHELSIVGQSLHRMFGIVVVPGHSIMIDKGEEFVSVFRESLLVALGDL